MTARRSPNALPHVRGGFRDNVEDEVRFHLESRAAELVAGGATDTDAHAQALREFGDLDDARSYMRQLDARVEAAGRRRNLMGEFRNDVTYALRRLRSAPAFAITAILTLALGIGANTAIFSMVYGVLLRPLPFPEPDQLYAVYSSNRAAGLPRAPVSAVDLDDWRAQRQVIADMGGYFFAEGSTGVDLTGRGAPRRLSAVFVTPGFFTTLGVQPQQGRLPREDEMTRGGRDKVAMLTHGFWVREFASASAVVGSLLSINGTPYEVLGVLPRDFRFPADDADVFVPYSVIPDSGIPRIRPVRVLSVVARAKPDVRAEAVRAEMMTMTSRLAAQYPEDRAWDAATVVPLVDIVSGPVRQGLFVLFGAVALVLVMACVNVAGLQLARAMGRGREMAVRLALGARRGRLIRQLLTESLLLSIIGGVLGLGLAQLGLVGLLALSAGQLPRAAEVSLDATMVAFAIAVSAVTGVLFGIVPALRMSAGSAQAGLREGGRSVAGQAHQRLRATLVVAEVAVAMMLVVGAGLMGRSFLALLEVDPGFKAEKLLAVQFTIDTDRHTTVEGRARPRVTGVGGEYTNYYQQVIEKVRTLPGVLSAAAVKDPPLRGNGERNSFRLPQQPVPAGEDPPSATTIHVSEGYFATIGARVEGREFQRQDSNGAPLVLVVNEAFARQFFPGERAVGKRVLFGTTFPVEIIGVVNDIRQVAVAEPARPTMYLHNLQNSRSKTTIVARTLGEPLAMANAVRDAIWSIDKNQALTAVFTFDEALGRALARPRLLAILLGAFGLVGLALGAVGIYGVLASLVSERRREMGVRLALGARPADVLFLIVRRGLGLTLIGVVIGLAGSVALSRFLRTVLYGVAPIDPATFAAMAMLLIGVAAIATWLPARRAARLDPVETLRGD